MAYEKNAVEPKTTRIKIFLSNNEKTMVMKRVSFFVNEKQFSALKKVRKQKKLPSIYALAKDYVLKGMEKDLQNAPKKSKR